MSFTSLGDAARFATFGQDVARLKSDLQRLGTELGTGRKNDMGAALAGDFSGLSTVERGLQLNESFRRGLSMAAGTAEARQAAIDRFAAELDGAGPELLAVVSNGRSAELNLRLADAADRFGAALATLNTRIGGQSLFAGTSPDQPAVADAETMLAALRPLVQGAADTTAAIAAIDAWFNDAGGGFETIGYLGGAPGGGQVYLGEGRLTDAAVGATEPGIRRALSGLAMAALAAEGSLPTEPQAQAAMAEAAADRMIAGNSGLIEIRARLGVAEGRIEAARVQAEAARTTLQLEQSRLVSADPFDTATGIEETRRQLESLYVLTARLSDLTLTAYLR